MTIYLNEYQKKVLKKLLSLSEENDSKKRLHFKKSDVESVFDLEKAFLKEILQSLKSCRFIDIPFENNLQIDIIIYKDMIEEQLQTNKSYVRRYKDYSNDELHFSSEPLSKNSMQNINADADDNAENIINE